MIKTTTIISGLVYVEIPQADLYIQCGAPAESVKHLMKNKIIEPISKDGVTFETGPNAILLSDTMIQNGEFSNMSEFSVLQMLYRQGMIIPNHPNNLGIKPILIGSYKQVHAQMQYIHRGNYGLLSKQEIEACGINSTKANELMNMKLKFAFGKLQSADNLLDSCIVEEGKVEIKNNVFIERKEHNIFTITYKNESVVIDLNLTQNQTYPSPYVLPRSKIKKEYFSVIHSGQGDGWDINRPSMNSIISFQGKLYAIDVVPNFKYILNALSIDINDIEGVFQTHTHDDHLAGITSLLRSDTKIKFFASKLVISATAKKISALLDFDEAEFYNLVDTYELKIDQWNDIDGLEVRPYISPHPVETTIFVFRTRYENSYKTYGHFADIIDIELLRAMIVPSKDEIGISQEFFDEVVENYMQCLDLKKIDIGGGMIHGSAKDFQDDATSKIVLAHTSKELTSEENRVGSRALFGLSDILISSNYNYDLDLIDKYLKSNFPYLDDTKIKVFQKFKVIESNPDTMIIKICEDINNLYLILSGQIELMKENKSDNILLTPGIIIGQRGVITQEPHKASYRAKSFVKLLQIPTEFFYKFIKENNLLDTIVDRNSKRVILQKTKLFDEGITYKTFNTIIEELEELQLKKGLFNIENNKLYIIISGEVSVKINDTVIDTLYDGDYFGGERAILSYPISHNFELKKDTSLYVISEDILKNIPIVRWKILEKIELQIGKVLKILI